MNTPKVTYIICHRNYQQYLRQSIQSAKQQTYPNIDICVIDDSSEDLDAVQKIVNEELFYEGVTECSCSDNQMTYTNDRHTFISLLNGPYGQGYGRNVGIDATIEKTDIYAILDADDENYPYKIERLVKVMKSIPYIGVVYADYDILNVETGYKMREFKESFDFIRLREECIVHSGSIISKEALLAIRESYGYFDPELPPVEDYDAWIRISEKLMIVHVPESLSLVRVHKNNSTNSTTNEFRARQLQKIGIKLAQRNAS